tara:strand:+ start:1581 stop:1784 length:204 start_codon:yes stop_codon:yes gene_type:complete
MISSFHEFLRPSEIKALGNAFLAAQLSNAVITAQTLQHDPDFVLGGEIPTGRLPDVLYQLLGGGFGL